MKKPELIIVLLLALTVAAVGRADEGDKKYIETLENRIVELKARIAELEKTQSGGSSAGQTEVAEVPAVVEEEVEAELKEYGVSATQEELYAVYKPPPSMGKQIVKLINTGLKLYLLAKQLKSLKKDVSEGRIQDIQEVIRMLEATLSPEQIADMGEFFTTLKSIAAHRQDNQAATAKLVPKCESVSEGERCWKEIGNQPGCYAWGYNPDREVISWSGDCQNGVAVGAGTMKTRYPGYSEKAEGTYRNGKQEGLWVGGNHTSVGGLWESNYVNGKLHGTDTFTYFYDVRHYCYQNDEKIHDGEC